MKIIVILALGILSGCGNTADENIPAFLGGGSGANSEGSSSQGNSNTGTGSSSGSSTTSAQEYTTTDGGLASLTGKFTLSTSTSETLKGLASDGTNFYLLTSIYVSYNSTQWLIRSFSVGTTSGNIVCDFLDSTRLEGGLAVDGSSFYILNSYSPATFQKINAQSCASETPLNTGVNINGTYGIPQFAYDSGNLYWQDLGGFDPVTPPGWIKYSPGSNSVVSTLGVQLIDADNSNWSSSSVVATTSQGVTWALFNSENGSGWQLWKMNDSTAIGLAEIPMGDLNYAQITLIAVQGNTVLLGSSADGSVVFYEFDVSQF